MAWESPKIRELDTQHLRLGYIENFGTNSGVLQWQGHSWLQVLYVNNPEDDSFNVCSKLIASIAIKSLRSGKAKLVISS